MAPDSQPLLISALPPTRRQERLAFAVMALLLLVFLATLPFRHHQLPRQDAFIPVVDTLLFIGDLITAVLLFAQFSILRTRGLLVLACGYLFASLIIVPHLLTFPGAFSPTGLLGAGLQSTVWLYIFWHLGLPPAAIAYALLKGTRVHRIDTAGSPRAPILAGVFGIGLLACVLTWLVTAGEAWLPPIMIDAMHASRIWEDIAAPLIIGMSMTAIALIWWRRSSVLDLWLLVVLWAWFIETVLLSMTAYRFSLVWYVGRFFGLASACFVLLVLLVETTTLYVRLALSVTAERREREGRLTSMDAIAAAIEHEIRQPLGAIVANANAGRRWLDRSPPDIAEVRAALEAIAADGHRSSDVMHSIREAFTQSDQAQTLVDANELIRETLSLVRPELEAAKIAVQLELEPQLPLVSAYRGQLQQVILNLVTNATDAMRAVPGRAAVLSMQCRPLEAHGVELTVADSGPGIDPQNLERIFEVFFTTKSHGMGLGLAICRSIIEAHGGKLWAEPGNPYGARFRMQLPARA